MDLWTLCMYSAVVVVIRIKFPQLTGDPIDVQ